MALDIIRKSIRNKLMMITGLATSVVVGTALVGFWYAWSSIDSFQTITDGAVANERTALIIVTEFKKQVQEWKDTLLRGSDPQKLDKYWGNFLKQEEKIQTLSVQLRSRLSDQDAKDLVDQFIAAHKTMGESYRKGLDAYKASGFVSHAGDNAVAGIDRAPTQLLEKTAKLLSDKSNTLIDASLSSARRHIILSIGIMLIAVVIATLFFLWFTQQYIVNPSRQLREDLARLASGNFTGKIESISKDEIGQIADSAQHLQEELSETIGHLSNASRQVADSSRRLTVVVEHTSQGVSQQRQQTDMVATAMNEMVATVQEVTRSASRAAESAYSADHEAHAGKKVIATTTDAIDVLAADVEKAAQVIHKLEENSNAIGSVLDVIRGIAEQTNLLALNAAIEAARAGEQGRGFAVVADEVRTLAQRTQQSTREIHDMIEQLQAGTREAVAVMSESQERAKSTVEHALQAGETLETIVNAISAISDMNSQIATAAEEQSTVAEEIGRNITAISQAAEQSAESAEQTSEASEELAKLANQLESVASRFKI